MRLIYDWLYYCFYCLAFAKGLKYERGAFGMNLSFGFYYSSIIITVISKLNFIENGMIILVLFFVLVLVFFKVQDYYFITKRRYRVAIDHFSKTPKFLRVIYGVFAACLWLTSFLTIFYVIAISPPAASLAQRNLW